MGYYYYCEKKKVQGVGLGYVFAEGVGLTGSSMGIVKALVNGRTLHVSGYIAIREDLRSDSTYSSLVSLKPVRKDSGFSEQSHGLAFPSGTYVYEGLEGYVCLGFAEFILPDNPEKIGELALSARLSYTYNSGGGVVTGAPYKTKIKILVGKR